jgi:hypothetical protein
VARGALLSATPDAALPARFFEVLSYVAIRPEQAPAAAAGTAADFVCADAGTPAASSPAWLSLQCIACFPGALLSIGEPSSRPSLLYKPFWYV